MNILYDIDMNEGNPSKSVLITGASTGIGEACAYFLNNLGYTVFATVRRDSDAEKLLEKSESKIIPIMLDVTSSTSIKDSAKIILEHVEDHGLYGLVNNAGIAVVGPLELIQEHDLRQQFDVNFFGLFEVTQAFLPLLRKAKGRIINISSISGLISYPLGGPYCASKFAVEALSDCFRMELKEWGIHVSIVEPGSIATPIWEKSTKAVYEKFAHLTPEEKALYETPLINLEKVGKEGLEKGIHPDQVAKVVAKILTDKKPKTRYIVGKDAKKFAWFKKLLPDSILDTFIRKEMGYK